MSSIRFAFAVVLIISGALPGCQASGRAARQQRVEHGLVPAIVIEGKSQSAWKIQDRMARYNVPGLGIAVIHQGVIDWSAAYGVRRAQSPGNVSTSTLFQAASVK